MVGLPPYNPAGNAFSNAGRAVSAFGQDVQQFGDQQQRFRAAYQEMVERRREKLILEEDRRREQERLAAKAAREKEDADREDGIRKRTEKVRGKIREKLDAGKPFTRQDEVNLYLLEDLEPPKSFFSPEPEKPEPPVNWVTETRPDGTYQVHPRTGAVRKVDVPGRPAAPVRTPEEELSDVTAALEVWQRELTALGPKPKATDYEGVAAWNRAQQTISTKIGELRAKEAGLRKRPRAGAAPLPDYLMVPIDENDPRVRQARQWNYTDEEIRAYLAGASGGR